VEKAEHGEHAVGVEMVVRHALPATLAIGFGELRAISTDVSARSSSGVALPFQWLTSSPAARNEPVARDDIAGCARPKGTSSNERIGRPTFPSALAAVVR